MLNPQAICRCSLLYIYMYCIRAFEGSMSYQNADLLPCSDDAQPSQSGSVLLLQAMLTYRCGLAVGELSLPANERSAGASSRGCIVAVDIWHFVPSNLGSITEDQSQQQVIFHEQYSNVVCLWCGDHGAGCLDVSFLAGFRVSDNATSPVQLLINHHSFSDGAIRS